MSALFVHILSAFFLYLTPVSEPPVGARGTGRGAEEGRDVGTGSAGTDGADSSPGLASAVAVLSLRPAVALPGPFPLAGNADPADGRPADRCPAAG